MVPDREVPGGEPRSFSPEIESALEQALLQAWSAGAPPETLVNTIQAAARDSRQQLLRAEEMLIAFKRLEARVTEKRATSLPVKPDERARLIRMLIEAYYR